MVQLNATEDVRACDHTIHHVGSTWMSHGDTVRRATEFGYDPGAFYFAGRCGVLGDVDASVIVAAIGWFEPGLVRTMWDQGVAVAGAREAARYYFRACAEWGEEYLADFAAAEALARLAERLVEAAEGSGLPLFSGWRAEPRVASWPGRLMQLVHILREWRGGLHLAATTVAGLTPLEAILTNEGAGQATGLGWGTEFPDVSGVKVKHDQAEQRTDMLACLVYERAFSPAERSEFTQLVGSLGSATTK